MITLTQNGATVGRYGILQNALTDARWFAIGNQSPVTVSGSVSGSHFACTVLPTVSRIIRGRRV